VDVIGAQVAKLQVILPVDTDADGAADSSTTDGAADADALQHEIWSAIQLLSVVVEGVTTQEVKEGLLTEVRGACRGGG
jgi:hypothetical protein